MPFPLAAKAGVIALSVAVATAIAIYESPEVRRRADELRRRIAIALQTLGENIAPNSDRQQHNREPMFNRPEDAEGFMMSHGASRTRSDPNDVVADEASRRRQREEILFWNRQHLERQKQMEEQEKGEAIAAVGKATREAAAAAAAAAAGAISFDQLLRQDGTAERGTYVVNTGADYGDDPLNGSLVRRRLGGAEGGVRGLNASVYSSNPFSDEFGIEMDEQHDATAPLQQQQHSSLRASLLSQGAYIAPEADELLSDIYNASDASDASDRPETPTEAEPAEPAQPAQPAQPLLLLETALAENEFTTAGQGQAADANKANEANEADAYNSIQAWAHTSSFTSGFYSPLPVSPVTAPSEPDIISAGELTPTDSLSVVDVPLHTAEDATTATAADAAAEGRYYDVVSDSEDSDHMMTPTSWTEVGSVVSESDAGRTLPAQ